jgi:hypothetical protein
LVFVSGSNQPIGTPASLTLRPLANVRHVSAVNANDEMLVDEVLARHAREHVG